MPATEDVYPDGPPAPRAPGSQYRGGPGLLKDYQLPGPAKVTFRFGHQFQHGGWGVFSGRPSAVARATFMPKDGPARALRPLETVAMGEGDRFRIELPGGGGYGDPKLRPTASVLADVLAGLVSAEAAARLRGGGRSRDPPH